MFTGLIQTTGQLQRFERLGEDARMQVRPRSALSKLLPGESIAVNGVCLTLERESGDAFWVYASAETLSRTTLGGLGPGAAVNLERALTLGDRLGGHFVSGHVDCVAEIQAACKSGQSQVFRLSFPEQWSAYVVTKGSVALDGVSLTINDCGKGFLEVNIVPATQVATTIPIWSDGMRVNMETDLIAKYVQRMLIPWMDADRTENQSRREGLSLDTLQKHGYF